MTDGRLPGQNREAFASGSRGGIRTGAAGRSARGADDSGGSVPSASAMRAARRRWTTGVGVLTTLERSDHQDLFRGATVSSFTVLSLEPPLVLVALSPAATSVSRRLSSTRPTARRGDAARRERRQHRVAVVGRDRQQEAVARKREQPGAPRDAGRPRDRLEAAASRRRPSASSSISVVPTSPPMLMSLPAAHRPASAMLRQQLVVAAQPLGRRRELAFQKGCRACISPRRSTAATSSSPGRASKLVSRRRARPSTATASAGYGLCRLV